ncbi:type II toxin-antitoxin system RelE/ParE family toxin [Methylotuvimicrobium sp. KM2]|uniref:type II toxin-antitoxin system RelE/ParE family toxin n=1 Tax=Methylotuvimicrobium sp. KM2 TaxID=3133976 RepID=UPI0031018074
MTCWTVRLARQAEQDIADILTWTAERFGPQQAEVYRETLTQALAALIDGPGVMGAKCRDDIQQGVFVLPVARHGRRGRHILDFRQSEAGFVDVLRVLHDSMDMARHIE